jgi:hypothetical protein
MRLLATGIFRIPLCLAAVLILLSASVVRADDFDLDPDQIRAALHTTAEEEGGFIGRTIAMVKAGTLPRDIFTSCFLWARRKPRHQFQYFKQALTTRAATIGIKL